MLIFTVVHQDARAPSHIAAGQLISIANYEWTVFDSARAAIRRTRSAGGSIHLDKAKAALDADLMEIAFSKQVCCICYDNPATHVCVPCGHQCGCRRCLEQCRGSCPICRRNIEVIFDSGDLKRAGAPAEHSE